MVIGPANGQAGAGRCGPRSLALAAIRAAAPALAR